MKKIFLVAGEASGDLHGSELAKELARLDPALEIHASGGKGLAALARGSFVESAHLNATGLTEVLKLLPQYRKLFRDVAAAVRRARPDLVVLIDNPGFNLRLAQKILPMGIPMVYYITPQIWGWGENRIRILKRCFRKALVVFRFEEKFYRDRGMDAVWVGHPLKDQVPSAAAARPRPSRGASPRVLLLPGSRANEVKTLFPILLDAASLIARRVPAARFAYLASPTLGEGFYDAAAGRRSAPAVEQVTGDKYAAMREADLAIACSGTVTLECALMGLPLIIVNRASFLTYLAVRRVIRVRYLGLPNLLADAPIVPELLQYDCTGPKIAAKAAELLTNPEKTQKMREDMARALEGIGPAGASKRAAEEILKILRSKNTSF